MPRYKISLAVKIKYKLSCKIKLTASSGYDVVVLDISEDTVKNIKTRIESHLVAAARRFWKNDTIAQIAFVKNAISRLSYSWNLSEAVKNADLVIEVINENLRAKQTLFAEIERVR